MKVYSRSMAAAVLAVAVSLSVPTTTAASPRKSRDHEQSKVVRIIREIQRLFSIGTNDDLPLPPPPKP